MFFRLKYFMLDGNYMSKSDKARDIPLFSSSEAYE